MPQYLSKQEAADRLGVSVKTVERHLKAGKLRRSVVHTADGPRVRVLFEDAPAVVDATFTVADETPVPTPTPIRPGIVAHVAGATEIATPEGAELAVLALRALDEVRRENERLRAVVESLRRPWWRKGWEKVRRRRR